MKKSIISVLVAGLFVNINLEANQKINILELARVKNISMSVKKEKILFEYITKYILSTGDFNPTVDNIENYYKLNGTKMFTSYSGRKLNIEVIKNKNIILIKDIIPTDISLNVSKIYMENNKRDSTIVVRNDQNAIQSLFSIDLIKFKNKLNDINGNYKVVSNSSESSLNSAILEKTAIISKGNGNLETYVYNGVSWRKLKNNKLGLSFSEDDNINIEDIAGENGQELNYLKDGKIIKYINNNGKWIIKRMIQNTSDSVIPDIIIPTTLKNYYSLIYKDIEYLSVKDLVGKEWLNKNINSPSAPLNETEYPLNVYDFANYSYEYSAVSDTSYCPAGWSVPTKLDFVNAGTNFTDPIKLTRSGIFKNKIDRGLYLVKDSSFCFDIISQTDSAFSASSYGCTKRCISDGTKKLTELEEYMLLDPQSVVSKDSKSILTLKEIIDNHLMSVSVPLGNKIYLNQDNILNYLTLPVFPSFYKTEIGWESTDYISIKELEVFTGFKNFKINIISINSPTILKYDWMQQVLSDNKYEDNTLYININKTIDDGNPRYYFKVKNSTNLVSFSNSFKNIVLRKDTKDYYYFNPNSFYNGIVVSRNFINNDQSNSSYFKTISTFTINNISYLNNIYLTSEYETDLFNDSFASTNKVNSYYSLKSDNIRYTVKGESDFSDFFIWRKSKSGSLVEVSGCSSPISCKLINNSVTDYIYPNNSYFDNIIKVKDKIAIVYENNGETFIQNPEAEWYGSKYDKWFIDFREAENTTEYFNGKYSYVGNDLIHYSADGKSKWSDVYKYVKDDWNIDCGRYSISESDQYKSFLYCSNGNLNIGAGLSFESVSMYVITSDYEGGEESWVTTSIVVSQCDSHLSGIKTINKTCFLEKDGWIGINE